MLVTPRAKEYAEFCHNKFMESPNYRNMSKDLKMKMWGVFVNHLHKIVEAYRKSEYTIFKNKTDEFEWVFNEAFISFEQDMFREINYRLER